MEKSNGKLIMEKTAKSKDFLTTEHTEYTEKDKRK